MDHSALITLPHGLWVDGRRRNVVSVRPVATEDENFILESTGQSPVARANALLGRCVSFSVEPEPPPSVNVSMLVMGDREALLLHLHRLSFSDDFVATFSCSSRACSETLELALNVDDLLVPTYANAAPSYTRPILLGDACYDVMFRLPTAGDQEEIAGIARLDADQAALHLLRRCVEKVVADGREVALSELAERVVDETAAAMAKLDPQAVIELTLACPACGSSNLVQFDAADFLLRKLDQRVDRAIREVHTLALWYHWSEEAILSMPADRRQKYLDLIAAGAEFAS